MKYGFFLAFVHLYLLDTDDYEPAIYNGVKVIGTLSIFNRSLMFCSWTIKINISLAPDKLPVTSMCWITRNIGYILQYRNIYFKNAKLNKTKYFRKKKKSSVARMRQGLWAHLENQIRVFCPLKTN